MANFPSLSDNPVFPIPEQFEDDIIRSPFEGGYEHTRPGFSKKRRIFEINYKLLSNADKDTLQTFEQDTIKGADEFDWTHPYTSETITVKLVTPIKYSYVKYTYWDVSFTIREV